ncbi:MAG TPA: secretin N-terminal domain-containing protein [Bryobacteraceae bacterium]|nr:secretin N-terminal domain-containing protein [Bryobacteraceae bacterium]
MRIVNRILLGLAMAGALAAQTPAASTVLAPPPEPPHEQRVFVLKYADAYHVANVLAVFGYGIKPDRDMHVIAVSAPPGAMTAIEDAIKRLDVPTAAAKDIDLVVYLVVAAEQPSAGAGLPSELQPVADQLRKIFSYKSFRLLDSILLRTQPGNRAVADGVITPGGESKTTYEFTVQPSAVTDAPDGRLIRLDNLRLSMALPGDRHAGFNTEITVREGQKVVVGKSNMGSDQALILVVTAKLTE